MLQEYKDNIQSVAMSMGIIDNDYDSRDAIGRDVAKYCRI